MTVKINPDALRVCAMCPNGEFVSKHHIIPKRVAVKFRRLWKKDNKKEYNEARKVHFNQWICEKHHMEIHKYFTNWELAWLVRQGIYPSIKEFKRELERRKDSKIGRKNR